MGKSKQAVGEVPMNDPNRRYMAYLLRLWQVQEDEGPAWRASLECAETAERRSFADLEALFAFLEQETGLSTQIGEQSSRGQEPR
jgi:hypothetical protein